MVRCFLPYSGSGVSGSQFSIGIVLLSFICCLVFVSWHSGWMNVVDLLVSVRAENARSEDQASDTSILPKTMKRFDRNSQEIRVGHRTPAK